MAIEIVDLPSNSMVIFHRYVNLPEGMLKGSIDRWSRDLAEVTRNDGSASNLGCGPWPWTINLQNQCI